MIPGAAKVDRCVKGHRDIRHFKDAVKGWICSACGKRRASFGPTWLYHGSIECKKCSRAEIDYVACSEVCRRTLDEARRSQ